MRWIGLAWLLAVTACGTSAMVEPQARTESATDATFSGFRTFAFRAVTPPADPTVGPGAQRPPVQRRVRSLIAARLMLKGYAEEIHGVRPDFVVSFDGAPGALVVDAFDSRTDASVWHGAAEETRDPGPEPGCLDDLQVRDEVERVLASFPARADEGALAEIAGLTW